MHDRVKRRHHTLAVLVDKYTLEICSDSFRLKPIYLLIVHTYYTEVCTAAGASDD